METTITPNAPSSTGSEQSAVPSLDSIAAKMTAMRNQTGATEQTATGRDDSAESSSPVTPQGVEVDDSYGDDNASDNQEADAQETVSPDSNDSSADELIDFLEFADTNPNAKFKFLKNGKEVIIDAKKAAAILGQGSAIHEEARQLKVDRAEFDEYLNDVRSRQEGLTLAMEFTVQPQLRRAYDEIIKTQSYQNVFQQQLSQTRDPAQVARIQANIQQNEQYIAQQQATIGQLKPAVDQFRQHRAQQVTYHLAEARKNFQDKELKNEYVFKEVRDKISKIWNEANGEIIPGVSNIDLLSSDEGLLSLVRDGLKYRDKPSTKSAGSSMAALTNRKGSSSQRGSGESDISKLREQAKAGDKNAGDNLLMAQLQRLRQGRGGR
jgi:Tfp pilus assembly protein PilE